MLNDVDPKIQELVDRTIACDPDLYRSLGEVDHREFFLGLYDRVLALSGVDNKWKSILPLLDRVAELLPDSVDPSRAMQQLFFIVYACGSGVSDG